MPKAKSKTKSIKKTVAKKSLANKKRPVKSVVAKSSKLQAPLFDTKGKILGKIALKSELFGAKPNKQLLTQAIRIYETNKTTHWGSTKTRSEVTGGGRKPWRQKGTGRARAGSTRSPLWVGGGVALGPKFRKVKLSLPKKMKRKALAIALSSSVSKVKVISNFEKIEAKTKNIAHLIKKLETKKHPLIITSASNNVKLASRNIPQVMLDSPENLNSYEILKSSDILFSKEALEKLYEIHK